MEPPRVLHQPKKPGTYRVNIVAKRSHQLGSMAELIGSCKHASSVIVSSVIVSSLFRFRREKR